MRRPIISTLLILALGVSPLSLEAARQRPLARPAFAPLPTAAIDALVADALAAGVPGVSIGIAKPGAAAYLRGYGFSDPARSAAVDTLTIFQIASISKQFTAAAILRLEEEGQLSTGDPVSKWIPELELGGRTVTIAELLSHTSGMRPDAVLTVDPYRTYSQAEMITRIGAAGFSSEPGERADYNNGGYYLLGVVIERASGTSYAELLEQRFFEPLGMYRTAYCGLPPAVPVPTGFAQLFGPAFETRPVDMSIPFAAGALCSTPADLVTWSEALSSGRAISMESYLKMITPARLNDETEIGYGLGIGTGAIDGRFATAHAGTILGFQTYMIHLPAERITVVVLVNALSSRSWARDIAREIVRIVVE
ncbi:MAG: serine hydrolase domain-containing protein [Thermoanaerobaculia bacterium]